MQRQQLCESRNIWGMFKWQHQQPHSLKQHSGRCRMQSETVRAILQVPTMSRMGKRRMMMNKIQSLASWPKMINLAGWWEQSPKQYSTAWRACGRSRWGLTNSRNRDGVTQQTTSVREIWSMGWLNWRFLPLWSPKYTLQQPHHHQKHLESLCRFLISLPDNLKCRKWCLDMTWSNEAGFRATQVRQCNSISDAWRGARFVTGGDSNASLTRELEP